MSRLPTLDALEIPSAPVTETIRIRGARVHNLQNVSVDLPRDALVVLTGVSGSGKSSLAFDTLVAEGQRRYLETLSTYTRQFLDQLPRPEVDSIEGLPPTISIDQRSGSTQPRSTLATTTEIYDYLRVLYARAGTAHCTGCGQPVARQTAAAIVDRIAALEDRRKVMILAPLVRGRRGAHRQLFEKIAKEGFVRARVDGQIVDVAEPPQLAKTKPHDIEVVVDRILVKDGIRPRLQESVELALRHGEGTCLVSHEADGGWHDHLYSEKFACATCGLSFPELEPRTFSFSSPHGACPTCQGLGTTAVDSDTKERPAERGTPDQGETCPTCRGARLNAFARNVRLAKRSLQEVTAAPVAESAEFFETFFAASAADELSPDARRVAERVIPEIAIRLRFLDQVGLGYLSLDRPTRTLSGGEFQRARLAACLGSGMIGVCYVLDEPTIGLHPRDAGRLFQTLLQLRDQGTTVVVVEHDMELVRRADWVVDLGPGAGREGGQIIAAGPPETLATHPDSVTGRFLSRNAPAATAPRRLVDPGRMIRIVGARRHNLQDVTIQIPLGVLTCVTGVSGSGKSSLVTQTLVPAVRQRLAKVTTSDVADIHAGPFDQLEGTEAIRRIIEIDQSPLGRSGRSNPATYSGVWDEVRRVFARTREARIRGFTPRRFSFNSPDGRCPECKGRGRQKIEMQFMPDLFVVCPRCRGDRFNRQTLSVRFAGRSVADVLRLRVDEAAELFANFPRLQTILKTFDAVGLGYLVLGQTSETLSGGEAQRVKLATELCRASQEPTLFVLDEPTTGLHPADIDRLLHVLHELVDRGDSVLVVEHQLDVIAAADWVVDLGPDGGDAGGRLVAEGPPAAIAACTTSHTGAALHASGRIFD